jgi:hypothetical protein
VRKKRPVFNSFRTPGALFFARAKINSSVFRRLRTILVNVGGCAIRKFQVFLERSAPVLRLAKDCRSKFFGIQMLA